MCVGPHSGGCPPSCLGWDFSRRQCWLVLLKAGGQDAVTACSYGRGSREARSRAPGRGGVRSRADLVPSVSFAGGPCASCWLPFDFLQLCQAEAWHRGLCPPVIPSLALASQGPQPALSGSSSPCISFLPFPEVHRLLRPPGGGQEAAYRDTPISPPGARFSWAPLPPALLMPHWPARASRGGRLWDFVPRKLHLDEGGRL